MPTIEFDFAENQKQWQAFRKYIKQPEKGGVLTGNWSPKSDTPLPLFFQTMVDDIQKWFNPSQGWKLAKLTTGLISLPRMEQSSIDEEHPEKGPWFKAKVKAPDQFLPVFHFDAENPPISQGLLGLGRKRARFSDVFDPDFFKSGRVKIESWGDAAEVFPDNVGSVLLLDKVINLLKASSNLGISAESLTAPYYLKRTTISLSSRLMDFTNFPPGKQRNYEPPQSLMVMLFLGDLVDYLRLEKNNIRRAYDRLAKRFPIELHKPQESPMAASESTK